MSNRDEDIDKAPTERGDEGMTEFIPGMGFAHHYGMGPRGLKALAKRFLGGDQGEAQVEPPTHEVVDVDYSVVEQRIILAHGEKARGVSTYEAGPLMEMAPGIWGEPKTGGAGAHLPDQQARYIGFNPFGERPGWLTYSTICDYNRVGEYGLTWVGWLEKYSEYDRGDFGAGSPNQGQLGTPIFQQTVTEELTMADAKAQGRWVEDNVEVYGDEPFMDEAYYLEAAKEEWDDEFDAGWKPGEGGI